MIAWLRGEVLNIDNTEIVISCSNIGYPVILGKNHLLKLQPKIGTSIELAVYTSVRENEISFFGFDSFFTRKVFMLLLNVNGIGPKASLNIVDHLDVLSIISSIKYGDFQPFLKVSGVGKKTAQRIILDLQGKIEGFQIPAHLADQQVANEAGMSKEMTQSQRISDARSALVNLGFSEKDVLVIIKKHNESDISLDQLIRKCLADLRK